MPINNESSEVIDHCLFTDQNYFLKWNQRKITALPCHLFIALCGILCILSALGGHYVDDDLVASPFVTNMHHSSVDSLRITTVACAIPLFWDLIAG